MFTFASKFNLHQNLIIMEKRFDILDFKTLNEFSNSLMKVRYELSLCNMYDKEEKIDEFLSFISQLYSDVCLEQSKRYANLAKKFDKSEIISLIDDNEKFA